MARKKRHFDPEEPSLMTIQDYTVYRKLIKPVDGPWWLRDAGYGDNYNYVAFPNGTYAGRKRDDNYYIRPVLYILFDTNNVGDVVDLHGHKWTKLRDRRVARYTNRSMFVCDEIIDTREFSKKTNIYEDTDIKEYLCKLLKLPKPKPAELTEADKKKLRDEELKAKRKQMKIDNKLAKKRAKEEKQLQKAAEKEAKRLEKLED